MAHRSVIIVLLFFAAVSGTGLLIALMVAVTARVGAPIGPWLMPTATFIVFVTTFFLARDVVLPPAHLKPAVKALGILSLWMTLTLLMWQAILWLVRPLMQAAGFERGTLFVLLGCLLGSVKILERLAARPTRPELP